MSEKNDRINQLKTRHMKELGALFGEYLARRPELDEYYIDESITELHESEWQQMAGTLMASHAMEMQELLREIGTESDG